MKVFSFSIFDCKHDWQFLFYLRGLWFNCAMIKIVCPDFKIYTYVEKSVWVKYRDIFWTLAEDYGVKIIPLDEDTPCKMMLWRVRPVFNTDVEYCFPRDADALVTYRETTAIKEFVLSKSNIHSIQDNPGHSVPLLGGLCGFRCEPLRDKYGSHSSLLHASPVTIDKHGSDQDFLTKVVYKDFISSYYLSRNIPRERNNPLWTSDLCISFIGTAGVNEFETLRYLRDNGANLTLSGVGRMYKKIFYWL
jgi:hypothetical protein